MGNYFSRPNRQNRRDQLQMRSFDQSASISTNSAPRKDHSTYPTLTTNKEDVSVRPSLTANPELSSHSHDPNTDINNEGYKAMLAYHDKLVITLATDYLNIAGVLLARGFISDEISAKMLLPSSTPNEKATILVTAVREKIKLTPQQFPELMKTFSEHTSTKCIVKLL